MKKESDAYFTVEAAILYPIILSVILLMTYLLLFRYDRCLLEQDIGKATVLSGSKWTLTKEQLNDYMQKKALHFDEEKYIAWENEDPLWNLEKTMSFLKNRTTQISFCRYGNARKILECQSFFSSG